MGNSMEQKLAVVQVGESRKSPPFILCSAQHPKRPDVRADILSWSGFIFVIYLTTLVVAPTSYIESETEVV